MRSSDATAVVVTGGGTSGHVLAALAVADALVARGHDKDSIHYVGTSHGVEQRLVPPSGYAYTLFDVVGLQRSLSLRNLAFLPKLIRSTWKARSLIRRLSPNVVVNVGGYASFPATFAAMLRRVPFVVVSYDRRPGLVSKLMAKRAAACAVAFAGSPLPHATLTGAPVRQEVIAIDRQRDRDAAREQLGLPADRFVFAVFGGSLGSQRLNEIVVQTVERLAERDDLAIYHVVGERNLGTAAPGRDGARGIMLVTGADPDVDRGQFAGRPFASAAQLAIALPPEIRAITKSIGVDATTGDLTLQLGDKTVAHLGVATDMSNKLVRLLSEVRGGLDGICVLDVSTSEISRTTC